MRRLFTIISIAVLAVMTSSCYDDSKIFGELSNLGDQILSMNDRLTKVGMNLLSFRVMSMRLLNSRKLSSLESTSSL